MPPSPRNYTDCTHCVYVDVYEEKEEETANSHTIYNAPFGKILILTLFWRKVYSYVMFVYFNLLLSITRNTRRSVRFLIIKPALVQGGGGRRGNSRVKSDRRGAISVTYIFNYSANTVRTHTHAFVYIEAFFYANRVRWLLIAFLIIFDLHTYTPGGRQRERERMARD